MSERTLQGNLCAAIDAANGTGALDRDEEKQLIRLSVALKGLNIEDVENFRKIALHAARFARGDEDGAELSRLLDSLADPSLRFTL